MDPSAFGRNFTKVKSENLFVQFAQWATTCNNNENHVQFVPFDMPEIVVVLQSLGFRIERIDCCEPKEVAPVSAGGQGVRVSVTCGHSGQRCILELGIQPHECNCVKVPGDFLSEGFWEVTATVPKNNQSWSVIESGSALIPSIPKDLAVLMQQVLNYFAHEIRKKTDLNQNMNCSPNLNKVKEVVETSLQSIADSVPLATSSTTDLRFGYGEGVNPRVCPNQPLSPASRYRSLDTLTSNNAPSELPEPGVLTKITTPQRKIRNSITQSSPNIKLAAELKDGHLVKSPSESTDYEDVKKLLRDSTELIHKALDILEQKTKISTPSGTKVRKPINREKNVTIKKFFETTLHRGPSSVIPKAKQTFGSSPLLVKKQNRNDQLPSHTSFTHSSSNRIRVPSASSIPSPHSPSKRTGSSSSTSKIPGSNSKTNLSANRPVRKLNSLYGHVKSTIPKPSSATKKEANK